MKKALLLLAVFALPLFAISQIGITITTTNVSCNSGCDGTATAVPTGGTPPYTYVWAPSMQTTVSLAGLCAGTYTVTVTDAMAGTATQTCVINQPMPLTLMPTPSGPTTICTGGNVAYSVMPSGGVSPYAFNWSFPGGSPSSSSMQSPVVNYSSPGMYNGICTVTDAVGCVAGFTVSITVSANPSIAVSEIPATCNQPNGTLTASGASAYSWVPGLLTGSTITNLAAGTTYTVTGTDFFGCSGTATITLTDSCDYVWPGDANDDAIADNIDILDIGIANGATGTTRANASTTWIGQPSAAWGQTLLSGTDYKWVDCDGNGVIDPNDTNAVVLNYGSVHSNRVAAPTYSSVGPDISISLWQDTLAANGMGGMNLYLGSATNPASSVYGIAFRLNYDAMEVSTPSFGMSGAPTWLGTPGTDQMRVVLHPNAAMGYVDVAITRLDQQNVSGQGYIGSIYFTATNNQVGSGNFQMVPFTISNVMLVNSSGGQLPINSVTGDTLKVCDPPLIMAVGTYSAAGVSVYPIPASDNINILIPGGEQQLVAIEDVEGRVVYAETHAAGMSTISVESLPAGIYMLRISDVNGNLSIQKITITH